MGPMSTELTSVGICNLNQIKFSTVSILLISNNEDLSTITGISNKNIWRISILDLKLII